MSLDVLRKKIEGMSAIPTLPAILFPLMNHLEQPLARVNVHKVVELIAHDESLSAQCLHMANSPLFGRWQNIDSIRGAVVALGIARMRDIALSCCVIKALPVRPGGGLDPRVFWEHSLGVALVSRRLARRVGFRDPEQAYMAGLLHDLGIVVNFLLLPEDFQRLASAVLVRRQPFDMVEAEVLGFTHPVSGVLLAEKWRLGHSISEVVRRHHEVGRASAHPGLVSLVHIADLICRASGLGYGYEEGERPNYEGSPAWPILAEECPHVRNFSVMRFASEMELYASEVRRLVGVLFRMNCN